MSHSENEPIELEFDINSYLRTRPPYAIPKEINDEIKLLTFNKKDPQIRIYGSFEYIIQKYAADIDLTENYELKGTKKSTILNFEKSLRKIVKQMLSRPDHWFAEFKTGYDSRYNIDIGVLKNGHYKVDANLYSNTAKMLKKGLLTQEESKLIFDSINSTLKNSFNSDAYDVIFNIFRRRKILRWTRQEIENKKKELPLGKIITLSQALGMKGHVKIDEIAVISNKFVEITNYLFIGYINTKGHTIPINLDKNDFVENVNESLRSEIEKLYLSNFYFSPFKAVKRIFALSRILFLYHDEHNYETDLIKIIPFVSSDVSSLYQIKSQLDAVIKIIELYITPPKKAIYKQIEDLKISFSSMIQLKDEGIKIAVDIIDDINGTTKKKLKIKYINELITFIKWSINKLTIEYFNKIKYNPPPKYFYPKDRMYALVKRNPDKNLQKSKLINDFYKLE
jgi:hypothetical protein